MTAATSPDLRPTTTGDHGAAGTRDQRRILLLGTHGQANIGDELLLRTFLEQLGPEHHYVVNSYSPDTTSDSLSPQYDVEVIDTATTRAGLIGHVRRTDAVVFAGGSVVKELYASVGRWRHATLVMVLGVVLTARVFRRPVLMFGIGVGPIGTRLGRVLARMILRSATFVAVRDAGSLRTCRELGMSTDRLVQIPDVVFANGSAAFGDLERSAGRSSDRVRIALNLNRDIANGERWDDLLSELAAALDLVAEQVPLEIHGLPMQSGFKQDDDLSVLRAFLARRPHWHPIVHETRDQHDVARVLADVDVVVSERFHAIVIAAILGRPVVGLCYDVKVDELVESLGLADRSVDVNEPVVPSALASSILGALADGDDEGDRLAHVAAELRADVVDGLAHIDQLLGR